MRAQCRCPTCQQAAMPCLAGSKPLAFNTTGPCCGCCRSLAGLFISWLLKLATDIYVGERFEECNRTALEQQHYAERCRMSMHKLSQIQASERRDAERPAQTSCTLTSCMTTAGFECHMLHVTCSCCL